MLKTKKLGARKVVAAASSLALVGGLAVASPAAANGGTVAYNQPLENGKFTWKISPCAFDSLPQCGSLTENRTQSADVVKGENGWEFSKGTGKRDVETGAYNLDFKGSITLGNTNRGNYSIKIANPNVNVSGDQTAVVTADISYTLDGGDSWTDRGRRSVTNLSGIPLAPEWTVSPNVVGSAGSDGEINPALPEVPGFNQDFVQSLSHDPDMRPWFQQSSTSSTQTYKIAQPVSVDFEVAPARVQLIGATGIAVNKSKTITVKGTGFDPNVIKDAEAPGLYVFFGPDLANYPGGFDNRDNDKYIGSIASPMIVNPNRDGQFTSQIRVTGLYEAGGKKFNGRTDKLGVLLFGAHGHSVPEYESFTKINFAPAVVTYSKPGKVRNLKRKVNKKRTKAKVSWKAPTATKVQFRNNKAVRYQVRVTNYKGKRYSSWKNRSASKRYISFNTKRRGTYKVQVRAVNAKGTKGSVRMIKVKKIR